MEAIRFDRLKRVLCVGAHSDDIEIGCGSTLMKLTEASKDLEILWVVFSAEGVRSREARASAKEYLRGIGKSKIVIKGFRTSYFPFQALEIKEFFETLKSFK